MVANYTTNADYYEEPHNSIAKYLNVTLVCENENTLEFIIKNHNQSSFEIPFKKPFPHKSLLNFNKSNFSEELLSYKVNIQENPFRISVIRKLTNEIIFDMDDTNFLVSKQYLEFGNTIPTRFIFGMGERNFQFRLKPGTYTSWARDEVGDIETGQPGHNSYGVHPMYLMKEKSGHYHVVYLRSSNPFDFIVKNGFVGYKIAGGLLHFKIFMGDVFPETAIKLYHEYIEGFTIPPFWAFGFHQSRWGYNNIQDLRKSIVGYKKHNIPIEAIWMDIDYMDDYIPFTVDTLRFSPLKLKTLKAEFNVKIVCIVDPAIPVKRVPPLEELIENESYIRDMLGNAFLGRLYSGDSIFPDFFHPKIGAYWAKMFVRLHEDVPFDGIWLDMNEPTNFCDGACYNYQFNQIRDVQDLETLNLANELKLLPYVPGNRSLESKTLSINAIHHPYRLELDVHNLYGTMETYETFKVLRDKFGYNLPFILTRNTFAGTGKYAAHWTGDNLASWDFLRLSVSGVFNFNMFGVPMIGDDICGFFGNTTEKLCARWIQLSSLYPFARNHNHKEFADHQFHTMGTMIADLARKAFQFRYSLLKYYYSLFLEKRDKGMIIKPLFFHYINDTTLLDDQVMNSQLMLGSSLMITPILENHKNFLVSYFPLDGWYNFHSRKRVTRLNAHNSYGLSYCSLEDLTPIFAREGSLIPFQGPKNVSNTNDLGNNFSFYAFLQRIETETVKYTASGNLIDMDNLNNHRDVEALCVNLTSGCLFDILLNVDVQGDSHFKISLNFSRNRNNTFSKDNTISKIVLSSLSLADVVIPTTPHQFGYLKIYTQKVLKKEIIVNQTFNLHPQNQVEIVLEFENVHIGYEMEMVFESESMMKQIDQYNTLDHTFSRYVLVLLCLHIIYVIINMVNLLCSVHKQEKKRI